MEINEDGSIAPATSDTRIEVHTSDDHSGLSQELVGDSNEPAHTLIPVPAVAVTLSMAILSLGVVASLFYFLWLCFHFPDKADTFITMVFIPVLTLLLNLHRTRKENKNK